VGGFIEFIAATGMLLQPLKRLTGVNEHVQRGLAACESVFGLVDQAPEEDRGTHAIGRAQGACASKDVTLTYRSAASPAVAGVSIDIRPGETVALVGPSGSGKSSLIHLLARFYHPDAGRITLDGHDIQGLTLESLRRQISLVSQSVVLFNDTVAANIAYGRLDQASEATSCARPRPPMHGVRARAAAGPVHAHRRERREALRRPAAARRHRARDPQGRARAAPRRGDLGARTPRASAPCRPRWKR
jgi:ABC-type multidrug transport system fused ATPase/permease subunit